MHIWAFVLLALGFGTFASSSVNDPSEVPISDVRPVFPIITNVPLNYEYDFDPKIQPFTPSRKKLFVNGCSLTKICL